MRTEGYACTCTFRKLSLKLRQNLDLQLSCKKKYIYGRVYFILIASTAMDIYHESSNIFQMDDECSKEYAQAEDLNNISGMERVMVGGGEGGGVIQNQRYQKNLVNLNTRNRRY